MKWEQGKFFIVLGVSSLPLPPWSRNGKTDSRSGKARAKLSWAHYHRAKVVEGRLSDDSLYGIHFHDESEYVLTHLATGMSLHRGTEEECKERALLFADTIKAYHAEYEGKSVIPIEPLGELLKAKREEPVKTDDAPEHKIEIPTRRRRRLT